MGLEYSVCSKSFTYTIINSAIEKDRKIWEYNKRKFHAVASIAQFSFAVAVLFLLEWEDCGESSKSSNFVFEWTSNAAVDLFTRINAYAKVGTLPQLS